MKRFAINHPVEQAANELARARFLLQENADRFVAAAKASDVMSRPPHSPVSQR